MPYNSDIHHRRSIRLKGYDYSQAGLYFITICCHARMCLFGNIADGEMKLNDAGKIADECWIEIPKHFPNAVLHEHIIMPNHVHGIIELVDRDIIGVDGGVGVGIVGDVGAENFLPLQQQQRPQQSKSHPQQHAFQKIIPRSIASIVKGFKIGVTKWFRQHTDIENVWLRNYHEHIIRNEQSYQTITTYILNNPAKWDNDKFYNQ